MRNQKHTIPLEPISLTECRPCVGPAHLRCDCPLLFTSDEDFSDGAPEFVPDEITQVIPVKK